jgi:hypothetical protein
MGLYIFDEKNLSARTFSSDAQRRKRVKFSDRLEVLRRIFFAKLA